jgi:hypothetical protein
VPGVDGRIAGRARGEPVETGRIELDAFAAVQHLRHHEDRNEGREDGAVLGGLAEDEIGGPDVAGARHVARNDGRVARDVVGKVTRHHPGIGIEAPADAGADDEIDGLALVEVGLRQGLCRSHQGGGERYRQGSHQDVCSGSRNMHEFAPTAPNRGQKAMGVPMS